MNYYKATRVKDLLLKYWVNKNIRREILHTYKSGRVTERKNRKTQNLSSQVYKTNIEKYRLSQDIIQHLLDDYQLIPI